MLKSLSDRQIATLERKRILAEYRRRESEIDADRYAPWKAPEFLMVSERKRIAALMLQKAGAFPTNGTDCLEIGYGTLGWLSDLVSWGVPESRLHGIELDAMRAKVARALLPCADLRVGDASFLPWESQSIGLVVVSTVFSSVLKSEVRQQIAGEIIRVLQPGGSLLWYDMRINNPQNPNVRRIGRRELRCLFSSLSGDIRSLSLAPPLARLTATSSWTLATALSSLPFLRTHLIAVLRKATTPPADLR